MTAETKTRPTDEQIEYVWHIAEAIRTTGSAHGAEWLRRASPRFVQGLIEAYWEATEKAAPR